MAKKCTRNFGDVIRAELAADPELARAVEDESFNADIAQQVYDLRTEAGMTQKQLADLVDTQQSVISRIEDADYDGHSLTMLRRIARALKRCLKVEFCARPVFCAAEVKEFTLDWSTQDQWPTTINAVKTIPIDLSGGQIPVAQPPPTVPLEFLFTRSLTGSNIVKI